MKIFFYAGKCLPIHAHTLDERPLGGTETGLIRVAEILHRRGHDVTVFTSHHSPPPSEPRYLFANEITQAGPCDALIAVQDWWALFANVPAQRRYFWTGDAADQYMTFGIGDLRVQNKIDGLICVSNWHINHLCEHSGYPKEKAFAIFNGVHAPWFEDSEERVPHRMIYTSAPYRGLDLAPGLFIELKKLIPDLELHVFSGLAVYDREKPFVGPEQKHFEKLSAVLKSIPGCFVHGNTNQQQLAREYMKSALLFYPNTFYETSCIAALEAQAAGCPIVTSALAALPETVGNAGVTVDISPSSSEYTGAFVITCYRVLTDKNLWNSYSEAGKRQIANGHSWEHVANRLELQLEAQRNTA